MCRSPGEEFQQIIVGDLISVLMLFSLWPNCSVLADCIHAGSYKVEGRSVFYLADDVWIVPICRWRLLLHLQCIFV